MTDEPSDSPQPSLRPRDLVVLVERGDVLVWRGSHRAVVEYKEDGKPQVATFWVDEEDGFAQLAHSVHPADDPELYRRWERVVREGNARLEAGLKRLGHYTSPRDEWIELDRLREIIREIERLGAQAITPVDLLNRLGIADDEIEMLRHARLIAAASGRPSFLPGADDPHEPGRRTARRPR